MPVYVCVSAEAKVTGCCELPGVGTGSLTWALWKSSKHSLLLSQPSSPLLSLSKEKKCGSIGRRRNLGSHRVHMTHSDSFTYDPASVSPSTHVIQQTDIHMA